MSWPFAWSSVATALPIKPLAPIMTTFTVFSFCTWYERPVQKNTGVLKKSKKHGNNKELSSHVHGRQRVLIGLLQWRDNTLAAAHPSGKSLHSPGDLFSILKEADIGLVIHDLLPSRFTAIDVSDAMLKRDVLSSKHGLPGLDAS